MWVDVAEAYYLPRGNGRYEPTRATESPWDSNAQHGGPPAALLAWVIDETVEGPLRIGRISVDMLGPIPRREAVVEVSPIKPGRRVQLTEARMSVDGRVAVVARAWHIATGDRPPQTGEHQIAPPPVPTEPTPQNFSSGSGRLGLRSLDRVAVHSRRLRHSRSGGRLGAGPAAVGGWSPADRPGSGADRSRLRQWPLFVVATGAMVLDSAHHDRDAAAPAGRRVGAPGLPHPPD